MSDGEWEGKSKVLLEAFHCPCGAVVPAVDTTNCDCCGVRVCLRCWHHNCPVCGYVRAAPVEPGRGHYGS